MKQHWQEVEAYYPSWNPYTPKIPSVDYIDSSAIYFNTAGLPNLPQFALKDSAGNYVKFYGNQEYLADIGNPAWWDQVIVWVQSAKSAGFVGVKFDDVNLGTIPHSTALPPVNPRTGVQYSSNDWNRDFANGLERVRSAFPKPFTIIHNSVWWLHDLNNLDIARAAKACDIFEHERGFVDTTFGSDKFNQLMTYSETLHSFGIENLFLGVPAVTAASAELNLVGALLVSNGGDWHYNELWKPDSWWTGNDYDLGYSKNARYQIAANVWRRDFEKGYVILDGPAKTGKVTLF